MIDERTKQMIEYYLPNPPDPDLPEGAYYWLQWTNGRTGAPRVLTVYPMDIFPTKDGIEYGLYTKHGCHLVKVDTGYGDPFKGVRMCDLYDNKIDCRNSEHNMCNEWEQLRKKQKEEGLI